MFYVIKWQTVCAAAGALALGAALLLGLFSGGEKEPVEAAFAAPAANRVIVVDAGHGGFDGGASDNGLVEKDLNLDVALRLKEYIEQGGGVAILTRAEDCSTDDSRKEGIAAKKADLEARKQAAEAADADLFVSIHMNKFPQSQYRGAQVFYGAEPEGGKALGEAIQGALRDVLQDGNTREAKVMGSGVYILKKTAVPSVIVECGFLSNPEEAALLKEASYRGQLAWGIYMGILRYCNDCATPRSR